jgi:hypothetical protein
VPWDQYLRRVPEFRDLVERLADSAPVREGPFERAKVRQVVKEFLEGDNRHQMLIRQLIMVTVWHQACFDVRSSGPGVEV